VKTAPDVPVFAVVGHPNKGKSSLVATLAQDDRVRIAPEPGTTTRATRYPLRLDGEVLYVLVDTPGFQRARAALAWMRAEAERSGANAAGRADVVAGFCAAARQRERFPDEVELLRPVVEGAGILYVVDGSVPYSREYEAEMEILRWTGRPSLAVVNPIGPPRHVDEWRAALGQYFRVVRVFDALHAGFEVQLDLLRAFAELEESWREPLRRAVQALEAERERRRERAAREIAGLLAGAAALVVEKRVARDEDPQRHRHALEARYRADLRRLERRCRREVEALYDFRDLDTQEPAQSDRDTERALLDEDLFSQQTWLAFGLRPRDVVAAAAAAGAATGGWLDVALGGSSLLLGAAVGGALGGALGWLGGDRLARVKVLERPLGGKLLRVGPARAVNLPVVLLGRARLHHALVAGRSHARRDRVELRPGDDGAPARYDHLDRGEARRLLEALRRIDQGHGPLEALVSKLLARDTAAPEGRTARQGA
jgi:hypothetical protein